MIPGNSLCCSSSLDVLQVAPTKHTSLFCLSQILFYVIAEILNASLPVFQIIFPQKRPTKHLVVGAADVETDMNHLAESPLFCIRRKNKKGQMI